MYKTHAETEPTPSPEGEWDAWNRWCDSRIAAALAEQEKIQIEAVGRALASERAGMREEVKRATASLVAELAELRGQTTALLTILGTKGDVVTLPGRKSNVA